MAIFNITSKKGVSSIRGFVVSQTPYDACALEPKTTDFTLTLYHDGIGDYPQLGDTIYKNDVATIKYTNVDTAIHRQIQNTGQDLEVDENGIFISSC